MTERVLYPGGQHAYVRFKADYVTQDVPDQPQLVDLAAKGDGEAPYIDFLRWAFPIDSDKPAEGLEVHRLAALMNQHRSFSPSSQQIHADEIVVFKYNLARLWNCLFPHSPRPEVTEAAEQIRRELSEQLGVGVRTLAPSGVNTGGYLTYEVVTTYTTRSYLAYLLWRADADVRDGYCLALCRKCGRPARLGNPKTEYCSKQCSAATRMGRWRKKRT